MKKYYHVFYWALYGGGSWRPISECIDKHPFKHMGVEVAAWAARSKINEIQLASWQEITKTEYELYKSSQENASF